MKRDFVTWHSDHLDKDMSVIVYGEGGLPFLAFPTQDSMAGNWEDFGMVDHIRDYIDGGRMQLFVCDTVDRESWSDTAGDPRWRTARQESYYHYAVDELVPFIHERNGSDALPIATGLSMGADHAAIVFLRRPDLFGGVLALSGVYYAGYFYGDYMDSDLYNNAPERFLPNLPEDHPYISLYNRRTMVFCVGQGAWEEDGVRSLRSLQGIFDAKGIHAWCDYWGPDVCHDWPWWFRQMDYFLPRFYE